MYGQRGASPVSNRFPNGISWLKNTNPIKKRSLLLFRRIMRRIYQNGWKHLKSINLKDYILFLQAVLRASLLKSFLFDSYPTNILIDKQGKIMQLKKDLKPLTLINLQK